MRSSFDPKDILARYGGEEFVILLKNTDHSEAMLQAERFRAVVEEAKFENEHTQPLGFVSISMGVSTYPEHAQDMASLIKMADDALYRAKKTSRNVVVSAQTLLENSSSDSSAA
jgi:diguanylate cyclase (GGDEF)-like protein